MTMYFEDDLYECRRNIGALECDIPSLPSEQKDMRERKRNKAGEYLRRGSEYPMNMNKT
jgi:hypothetical protein